MKLYYAPGACSLAAHIVAREVGLSFDLDKVDLGTKQTAGGEDYTQVNPKGYVPALKLADGQILTEAAVIVQYLADQKPQSGLAPTAGTLERYRLMEWLNFISSEIHKTYGPLWKPDTPEATKQSAKDLLGQRFDYLVDTLGAQPYLMGEGFSVADAYLFTVLNWTNIHHIDLGKWPALKDYRARIGERPRVKEAMKAEGLLK